MYQSQNWKYASNLQPGHTACLEAVTCYGLLTVPLSATTHPHKMQWLRTTHTISASSPNLFFQLFVSCGHVIDSSRSVLCLLKMRLLFPLFIFHYWVLAWLTLSLTPADYRSSWVSTSNTCVCQCTCLCVFHYKKWCVSRTVTSLWDLFFSVFFLGFLDTSVSHGSHLCQEN